MRDISITVYKFSELNSEAKERAINEFRGSNLPKPSWIGILSVKDYQYKISEEGILEAINLSNIEFLENGTMISKIFDNPKPNY